jgi:outer membrane biosynthesis protein TonB
MTPGLKVAGAIGVGYVLGRKHKMRMAMTLGTAAAVGQLGQARDLLKDRATEKVASSANLGKLAEPGQRLLEAGEAAAMAAVTSRIDSVSDQLHGRAEALRRPGAAAEAEEPEGEEAEAEEPEGEEAEAEEPEGEEAEAEEPKAKKTKDEEPKAKKTKDEEPKAKEPKAKEPKAKKTKDGEPKAEEKPADQAGEKTEKEPGEAGEQAGAPVRRKGR